MCEQHFERSLAGDQLKPNPNPNPNPNPSPNPNPNQAAPFGVQSAFNGLAVYHVGALALHNATGCRFEGSRMSRICEHVPFSLCLGRHGLRLGVLTRRPNPTPWP